MPHTCSQIPCACCFSAQTPQTIAELQALTEVTELGHSLETLVLMGTQFEDALFTTRNAGGLISGCGGYGPLQTTTMPFRISRRRVTLRLAAHAPIALLRSKAERAINLPGALLAVDCDGEIHHRVQYKSAYDQKVAASLEPDPQVSLSQVPDQPRAENIVPFSAIRHARAHWDRSDAGMHLNDVLKDGGCQRLQCLPHVGDSRAWRIVDNILPSFLCYLTDHKKSFARMVPGHSLIQAAVGLMDQIVETDGVIVAFSGLGVLSIDMKQVASAWVIASGQYWHLELYDETQKVIAILAADPSADGALWRDLLVSLPRLA